MQDDAYASYVMPATIIEGHRSSKTFVFSSNYEDEKILTNLILLIFDLGRCSLRIG